MSKVITGSIILSLLVMNVLFVETTVWGVEKDLGKSSAVLHTWIQVLNQKSYILFQDTAGGAYSNCQGKFAKYAYIKPDHPNRKELYALLLMSKATQLPVGCNYEAGALDDPNGCPVTSCGF